MPKYKTINKITDHKTQNKSGGFFKKHNFMPQVNMFDKIMPSNEVITDDLMNIFGGNQLNDQHEKMEEQKKKNMSPE